MQVKREERKKMCLSLFTCSFSRAIHLEVVPNQTTQEFTHALKRLNARRGRPKVIYSDNVKNFVDASKLINKDESMQEYGGEDNSIGGWGL